MEKSKLNKETLPPEQKQIMDEVHREKTLKIIMNVVPNPTREKFLDWSYANFNGSHGYALKHLWDFYHGAIPEVGAMVQGIMDQFNADLAVVKEQIGKGTSVDLAHISVMEGRIAALSDHIGNLQEEMKKCQKV